MFRLEIFCEDKNLPRVLHSLTGLIADTPKIQPVANAKMTGGKIKAKVNGNLPELFKAFAKKNKLATVTPAELKTFAVEHGYAETSYSLFLARLVKEKILRKRSGTKGNRTAYMVLK